MLPVDDRDPVAGAALYRCQDRPDMRPGGQHGPFRDLAGQRQSFQQAKLAASEYRDRVAKPIPAPGCHQLLDRVPVRAGYLSSGAPAAAEAISSPARAGNSPQLCGIEGNWQVQRQDGCFRCAYGAQLLHVRWADHHRASQRRSGRWGSEQTNPGHRHPVPLRLVVARVTRAEGPRESPLRHGAARHSTLCPRACFLDLEPGGV